MKPFKAVLTLCVVSTGIFAALTGANGQSTLPDGSGREVVEQNCTACHGADVITAQRRTPDGWVEIVNQMIGNGATLTDDQYKQVVAYLGTHLGTASGPAAAPGSVNATVKTPARSTSK